MDSGGESQGVYCLSFHVKRGWWFRTTISTTIRTMWSVGGGLVAENGFHFNGPGSSRIRSPTILKAVQATPTSCRMPCSTCAKKTDSWRTLCVTVWTPDWTVSTTEWRRQSLSRPYRSLSQFAIYGCRATLRHNTALRAHPRKIRCILMFSACEKHPRFSSIVSR